VSFNALEESVESSAPLELYLFEYQGGALRYTTDADDVTHDGAVWAQVPGLARSAIEDTGDIAKSSLTLTAPENFPPALLFEVYPPSDVLELTVYRLQRGAPADAKTIWIGRVLNAWWSIGHATLTCQSLFTRLKQPGLRRIYSKNCPHLLYGAECAADPAAFAATVTLEATAAGGFELLATGLAARPDGYYSGGRVSYDAGAGLVHVRGIREHAANRIVITHPIPGIPGGAVLSVLPGCDRTVTTCQAKFANLRNYGGFPYMRDKNPFGSSSVY
jgi:uncharacterized phage protein (TIGR02218 family)